jgi:CDP-diacylglycerol--glycerol-3-phosphate 3-phosphatidyltransferase
MVVGVSANTITALSFVAGTAAGVLLGCGYFGIAGMLFVAASLGDVLDGLVARATHSESVAGALFDASADRYEEFFAFGGLAVFFRASGLLLTLTLAALVGSFMVSYGSAQAEARRIPVPPGIMRRPERAVCLGVGTILVPVLGRVSHSLGGPSWVRELPVILAMLLIAVGANFSAVRRLRDVAAASSPRRVARSQPLATSAG